MFGNYFILLHTNRSSRKNIRRFSSSYQNALTIGVLCSYKSLIGQNNVIEEFVEDLKNKGKKVSMLVFHENSSNIDGISSNSFSKRDLNFFGFWKKERVKVFIEKEFDFLINLDLDYNLYMSNVLAASRARCRTGIHDNRAEPFLELMIKPEANTVESLIKGTIGMLERIKNEEE